MTSVAGLKWAGVCTVFLCLALAGCPASSDVGPPGVSDTGGGDNGGTTSTGGTPGGNASAAMTLASSAFAAGGAIPVRYASTYVGGDNISPPLSWSGVPGGTVELALIMDDPDAFGFVHWVIYKIPAGVGGLPEGILTTRYVLDPAGAVQGTNSAGDGIGYYGPEPDTTHHYRFRLYALDFALAAGPGLDASQLLGAMGGHILAEAELNATFTP